MPLHICIFTTAHPWDDVRVKSKFVDSFLEHGHQVTWVGPDRAFFETASGQDTRVTYRLLPSRGGWADRLRLFAGLRRQLRKVPAVDWIYTPDPDAAALALSARTGARVLFDIHEEYHKGHFVTSLPARGVPAAQAAVRATIAAIAHRAHLVTAVNQAILDSYHAPRRRSIVTFNTPPGWFTRPEGATQDDASGTLTLFHGKALAGNGTDVILQALQILQARGHRVRVIMFPSPSAGSAPYDPGFADRVDELGVADALDLRPAVTHREMPAIMSQAHVGMIGYDRNLGVGSLPNRFFEYMALGLPVLIPEYSPLMRSIVENDGIGWSTDFESPEHLAASIEWMSEHRSQLLDKGSAAGWAFQRNYAWTPIINRLLHRMQA